MKRRHPLRLRHWSPQLLAKGGAAALCPLSEGDARIHAAGHAALARSRGDLDGDDRIRLAAGLPAREPEGFGKALATITDGFDAIARHLAGARQARASVPAARAAAVPRVPPRAAPRAMWPRRVPSAAPAVPRPPRRPDPFGRWTFYDFAASALDDGAPDLDRLHAAALAFGAPDHATAADWCARAIASAERHRDAAAKAA